MKFSRIIAFLLVSFHTFASSPEWIYLKTTRGTDLQIKITQSSNMNSPILIIAPGQSCNSKGSLFETIEQEAIKKDLNIVRFEWSYCAPTVIDKNPIEDLSSEISDMNFVINYSKEILHKTDADLLIAGKSLGSLVAYQIFQSNLKLKSLTLLTPVCSYSTDEQGNDLPTPLNVIDQSYPNLLLETRPILMISGNSDSLCDHQILDQAKINAPNNIQINYHDGNHSFTIKNADGSSNEVATQKNLVEISDEMLNWFYR